MKTLRRALLALFAVAVSLGAEAGADAPQKLAPVVVNATPPPLARIDAGFHLRLARFGAAAVTDGTYLYIVGGSNSADTPLTEIERFDPRSGRSEIFARLVIGRRGHRAVLHEGKIHVLGGYNALHGENNEFFERSTEIVDLATRRVSRGPDMPSARANFGCVAIAGQIHVIGGARLRGQAVTNTNTVDVLDLATGKWHAGVPMPTPRQCVATTVGNFIMVAGGFTGGREVADVEAFALDDRQWRALPKLARPANVHSALFTDHSLLLFSAREVIAYDLKKKQSEAFPLNTRAAREACTVVLDGRIYVCGGMERNIGTDDSMAAQFSAAPKPVVIPRREPDEQMTAEWAAVSQTEDLNKLHILLNTTKDFVVLDDVQVFDLRSAARVETRR